MNEKPDTTIIIATAAVTFAAGLATYMLFKTYKALERLENIDLDFGNDPVLSSHFKKD